jgi:hypothetical protein
MGRRAFCFPLNASFLARLSRKIRTLIWLMQASAVRRNKRAETEGARLGICLQSLRSPGAPWRRLRNPCNQLHALLTIGYFGTHIGQQSATSRQTVRKSERRLSARDLPLPDYRMRSVAGLALVFAQRLAPL